MVTVCSYCRKHLRGEVDPNGLISHGICSECNQNLVEQAQLQSLDDFLKNHALPVVIVNSDRRVRAANELARNLVQKGEESYGVLGGEFLECIHAKLPEGCGNTIHCSGCTIRRAVQQATKGENQIGVPAYLNQSDQTVHMLISAQLNKHRFVIVTINKVVKVVTN